MTRRNESTAKHDLIRLLELHGAPCVVVVHAMTPLALGPGDSSLQGVTAIGFDTSSAAVTATIEV